MEIHEWKVFIYFIMSVCKVTEITHINGDRKILGAKSVNITKWYVQLRDCESIKIPDMHVQMYMYIYVQMRQNMVIWVHTISLAALIHTHTYCTQIASEPYWGTYTLCHIQSGSHTHGATGHVNRQKYYWASVCAGSRWDGLKVHVGLWCVCFARCKTQEVRVEVTVCWF